MNLVQPQLYFLGPYRGRMWRCYHSECDNYQEMEPNIDFLAKITQAAVWTMADLAQIYCPLQKTNIDGLFNLLQNGIVDNAKLNEIGTNINGFKSKHF